LNAGIESEAKPSENATMKSAYVVRELVSVASGEKELRTHYEYGTFPTYQAANQCAIGTRNPYCFPQREEVCPVSRHEAATLLPSESLPN
jgi:hypothetical protein